MNAQWGDRVCLSVCLSAVHPEVLKWTSIKFGIRLDTKKL